MLKVFAYKNCDTCRKALQWLKSRQIPHQVYPIRDSPPSPAELRQMLKNVAEIKQLFNTSGQDYRALNLKDKLPSMTEAEALHLLAHNGNLIKRPFVLGPETALLGFKEPEWTANLQSKTN
ncbi:MAG: arsenate reductase family protein [Blastochloris sp.]|nr:arsenate reductase family protein [Blastochloris sp.]